MKTGSVYLRLFGDDRKLAFGPYNSIRFTDDQRVCMKKESETDVLYVSSRGVYFDAVYFTEWSIGAVPERRLIPFDRDKAEPSPNAPAAMTLEERFRRVHLLCASLIEDRIDILCEGDPLEREWLLTSDIEDQLGHWRAAQKELMELR